MQGGKAEDGGASSRKVPGIYEVVGGEVEVKDAGEGDGGGKPSHGGKQSD